MNHMTQVKPVTHLTFTPDMATGIRAIDNDHRMLIDIANSLADDVAKGGGVEHLGASLEALIRYVEEHFAREEKIITDCAYENLAQHMREHQNLARSVYEIHRLFRTDPDQVPWDQVVEFVSSWLKNHILQSDKAYVPCVRNFDGTKKCGPQPAIQAVTLHVAQSRLDLLFRCSNLLLEDGKAADLLERAVSAIEDTQAAS